MARFLWASVMAFLGGGFSQLSQQPMTGAPAFGYSQSSPPPMVGVPVNSQYTPQVAAAPTGPPAIVTEEPPSDFLDKASDHLDFVKKYWWAFLLPALCLCCVVCTVWKTCGCDEVCDCDRLLLKVPLGSYVQLVQDIAPNLQSFKVTGFEVEPLDKPVTVVFTNSGSYYRAEVPEPLMFQLFKTMEKIANRQKSKDLRREHAIETIQKIVNTANGGKPGSLQALWQEKGPDKFREIVVQCACKGLFQPSSGQIGFNFTPEVQMYSIGREGKDPFWFIALFGADDVVLGLWATKEPTKAGYLPTKKDWFRYRSEGLPLVDFPPYFLSPAMADHFFKNFLPPSANWHEAKGMKYTGPAKVELPPNSQ